MPLWIATIDDQYLARVYQTGPHEGKLIVVTGMSCVVIANERVDLANPAMQPTPEDAAEWTTIAVEAVDKFQRLKERSTK